MSFSRKDHNISNSEIPDKSTEDLHMREVTSRFDDQDDQSSITIPEKVTSHIQEYKMGNTMPSEAKGSVYSMAYDPAPQSTKVPSGAISLRDKYKEQLMKKFDNKIIRNRQAKMQE